MKISFKHTGLLSIGLFCLIVNSLITSILPIVLGSLFDKMGNNSTVESSSTWNSIVQLNLTYNDCILILVFGAFISFLFGFYRAFIFEIISESVVYDMRDQLFAKTINKSIQFFDENKTGDLNSRLSSDCTLIRDALTTNFSFLFRSTLMFIISTLAMFFLSWKLTLVLIIPIPILIIIIVPFGTILRTISKDRQNMISNANAWSEECFSNIHTLKSFGNEWHSHVIYRTHLNDIYRLGVKNGWMTALLVSIFMVFPWVMISLVLW